MKTWIIALLCLALSACATAPKETVPVAQFFHDREFTPPAQPADASQLFTLTPAMHRYLDSEIVPQQRRKGSQLALFDTLYTKGQLKIDYDASMTRNAAQTFDARAGNCLSLVIMTAAFAKEMHLTVTYNLVPIEDDWVRSNTLQFSVGHVNLTLGTYIADSHTIYSRSDNLTIDFVPSSETARKRSRELDESTIVAMYLNNRAAELLSDGKLDDSYWWARAAVSADPSFLSAYNTLGVVYLRHRDFAAADAAFRYVLNADRNNVSAMSNRIASLNALGRSADANVLAQALHVLQPQLPFEALDAGIAAMRAGDVRLAQTLFARELQRDPYNAEAEFWLASAYARLGNRPLAQRYLRDAIDNSTTGKDRDLYVAKLRRLKASAIN